jgi:hypothetical protein
MSKRSRDVSFSPVSDDSPLLAAEGESDALEGFAPPSKYSQTDSNATATYPSTAMQCTLAPHREMLCFDSQEEYEVHYAKEHTNRCSSCSNNFPSSRFLELHIEENHNSLREALASRGEKTYGCFVEGCDRKCSTPQKRRLHLIDKHMFPKTYNFRIVDCGIDKASSMLREGRRRRVSTANDNHQSGRHRRQVSSQLQARSTEGGEGDTNQRSINDGTGYSQAGDGPRKLDLPTRATPSDMVKKTSAGDVDSLTQSLSALMFVPTSVLRRQNQVSLHPGNRVLGGRRQDQPEAG